MANMSCITAVGGQRSSKLGYSSSSTDSNTDDTKKVGAEEDIDDFLGGLKDVDLAAQGVDPKSGWGFRGVHKVFHSTGVIFSVCVVVDAYVCE